ncbi:hypothetical protein KBA41_05415 [Candidatus Ozemobacteraceae bacterium]|nr:hypothetical protein [Candidatus Ozemobacteraceae bacterium]
MTWFFAFSSVGVALTMIMAAFRRTLGLRWLEWLGGIALFGLIAGLLVRYGGGKGEEKDDPQKDAAPKQA